jgi:hypothetical protein
VPRSEIAITEIALLRPSDVSVVPSIGSTAMSHAGAAGADLLAVEQHRRFVLLTLADDDDAFHRDGVEDDAHGVDRGAVGSVLVALPEPASGCERRASVTRTSSSARLRSGAWVSGSIRGA